MKTGTRIGLAVGFGYLLGRRRKMRTALTLAAAVAAGRASRDAGGLLKRGTDVLHSSPHLSSLTRLGGPLVNAGRSAASAAAGSGVDALSGRLRSSADALRSRSGKQGGDEGADRGDTADRTEQDDATGQRRGR
ncbi:hypothetical protein DKT68_14140 [Micromonospora acroterricola]|uniref:Uncharacterized protein n=1 Tax=Micromonospora acroterricola TaxID=2202421 RepID=A0A317D1X6_9ACTN|nr:hypothetical protein [Micromonospora acroterricola]PWR08881.1 hypothetical protein DKT68_14140 [Micromonospora acroterricola]